jgi:hypothetical protein
LQLTKIPFWKFRQIIRLKIFFFFFKGDREINVHCSNGDVDYIEERLLFFLCFFLERNGQKKILLIYDLAEVFMFCSNLHNFLCNVFHSVVFFTVLVVNSLFSYLLQFVVCRYRKVKQSELVFSWWYTQLSFFSFENLERCFKGTLFDCCSNKRHLFETWDEV